MTTDKRTIEWYNKHAKRYAEHIRNPDEGKFHSYYEKPAMYGLLPGLLGKSVISLGCGTGDDSHYLKQQGAARSVGIDISEGQFNIAQESYSDCEFFVMDMEHLDFADESFDFAYSSLALSYIKDWQYLMTEVSRVLKPGAKFLFSCEHPVSSAMDVTIIEDATKLYSFSIRKDKTSGEAQLVGDYLNQHKSKRGIAEEVTTWHRPFSKLFADILSAQFVITNVVEPLPKEEMNEVNPATYQALGLIPDFLIVELEKSR